ncbi:hypothetical protein LJ707_07680 [Mucilaginibacter sp. UR6-1]|uniref:hypothetical protein n=1 Tax=Mucilaginibacter sp. UR6-1 TaxID=1435643 RepID=UPI001E46BD14|nr:hypothetical protein [Mucilaginibacter sp. UR6-1]MCC8408805.1 hypothetical protein [Mucilaginibacter sp. UR6-1]
MFKKALLIVFVAATMLSCGKKNVSTCQDKVCTEEFAMILMLFKDKDGPVKSLSKLTVINKRTNQPVDRGSAATINTTPGYYLIIDDRSTKGLSESGDDILITATDSTGTQTKTAIIKVAGGACACHIKKLSGPDELQFN